MVSGEGWGRRPGEVSEELRDKRLRGSGVDHSSKKLDEKFPERLRVLFLHEASPF